MIAPSPLAPRANWAAIADWTEQLMPTPWEGAGSRAHWRRLRPDTVQGQGTQPLSLCNIIFGDDDSGQAEQHKGLLPPTGKYGKAFSNQCKGYEMHSDEAKTISITN